jgi:hypothetical protein
VVGLVPIVGCAGDLSNPSAFLDGGTPQKQAEDVFAESCGTTGCHDASPQAQAGLDLISPNVESRVVDVNAIGLGCATEILVVAGDPDSSYLLEKVLNTPGICGLQMPVVGSLSASDTEVLRQWIIDLGGSDAGALDGG